MAVAGVSESVASLVLAKFKKRATADFKTSEEEIMQMAKKDVLAEINQPIEPKALELHFKTASIKWSSEFAQYFSEMTQVIEKDDVEKLRVLLNKFPYIDVAANFPVINRSLIEYAAGMLAFKCLQVLSQQVDDDQMKAIMRLK